ncbi:MAG TPA: HAMP domain-containing sensor histidine kinase, partial [Chroococcales cyanobacterium]
IEGLKQADRLKDDFLSVISHELRTPLNGIMGFGSILLDELQGLLNPPQRRSVEKILMSTDRMLELVDSLLDFTRLRAGLFSIFPKKTPYPVLLQEAVVSMRPLARAKGIEIESEVFVPSEVSLDRQRIFQVLANLISNALKFTPRGGKVAVSAFVEENRLVTEVRDSGIGIDEEDLPRLFSPFQQLDTGLTRGVEGTGIGLSICKEILTLHGGFIEAESEGRDKGCTFRFVLPAVPKGESPT